MAEVTCKVSSGSLSESDLQSLAVAIKAYDGKFVTITVRERKRRRSTDANRYYWGVVVPAVTAMFRDAGNNVDDDDVHLFLKLRVGKLSQNIVTPDGEVIKSIRSTKNLTTSEFQDYLAKIMAWAAELGCEIPLPHEHIGDSPCTAK